MSPFRRRAAGPTSRQVQGPFLHDGHRARRRIVRAEARFALVILLVLAVAACSPRESDDVRRFQLAGTVSGFDKASSRVVVAHDAVNGLMPAMSMPFEVRGDSAAMHEGDRIMATLVVTDSRSWLEDVKITASGGIERTGVAVAGRAAPGVVVPAFPLIDQNGRTLTLRDFAGRVLVITFIYTRCPLPDFCPLMVKHLESVRRRANEERVPGRVALLGVTLDPVVDTPGCAPRVWRIGAEGVRQVRPLDAGGRHCTRRSKMSRGFSASGTRQTTASSRIH